MAMDTRTRILEAAERLLDASPTRDVATRDVCQAAGVAAPVLYRHFGDKNGLLRAVVDHGFERYLSVKRTAEKTADPVEDIRKGWDTHVQFALDHPAVYRLMYSPAFDEVPEAAGEAIQILRADCIRCQAEGVLAVSPDEAAQAIMAANIGVALSIITQPERYRDPSLSRRVRDAVHRDVLTPAGFGDDRTERPEPGLPGAAERLAAHLAGPGDLPLSPGEATLLEEWLARLRA